ncbi:MAG: GGDEF domain-containing protein, partial [Sideroxydans sp.]
TRCHEEIANVRRYLTSLTCMFLDIDKFKRINDEFGHPAGDEVIRNIARLIKSQLRSNDILARFGGEEFVVLLPQTGIQRACEIAERIRHLIATKPLRLSDTKELPVTISIGIASLPEDVSGNEAMIANDLISAADGALYLAKKGGRNRVMCEDGLETPIVPQPNLTGLFLLN